MGGKGQEEEGGREERERERNKNPPLWIGLVTGLNSMSLICLFLMSSQLLLLLLRHGSKIPYMILFCVLVVIRCFVKTVPHLMVGVLHSLSGRIY